MVYYMHRVYSRNGIAIRLTNGRWFHITNNHPELMGYYYEVLETLKNLKQYMLVILENI